MKILVLGAGILGCNLANDLFRAGKDVMLLARGAWGEEIQKNGLKIKSIFSPWETVSCVPVKTELKPEDSYDVIFEVVRYTQIKSVLDTLCANRTKNITYLNRLIDANIEGYHAMNAVGEMNVLNRDIKQFFKNTGEKHPTWQSLEQECGQYLERNA